MKHLRRIAWVAGLIVLGLGVVQKAEAANPDTMRVLVQPDATYAVTISSPFVQGYNFGLVGIGVTTISTVAIAVQNTGNIMEYFSIGVQDVTPTYGWTNNEASLNPGTTSYVMQGVFLTAGSNQPPTASFNGAANNIPAAPPATAESKFGQAAGVAGKTSPSSSKDLWLRLHMPTVVYDSGIHTLILSINGQNN